MAKDHSFDISASIKMDELKNAFNLAQKELSNRYDFKGVVAEITLNEKEKNITVISSTDNKVDAIIAIIDSKAIKRNISPKALKEYSREDSSGGNRKAILTINDSISKENAKKITKAIKSSKLKVSSQIQEDEIRVTSKSIDELQNVMKLVRELDLDIPLSFKNLK